MSIITYFKKKHFVAYCIFFVLLLSSIPCEIRNLCIRDPVLIFYLNGMPVTAVNSSSDIKIQKINYSNMDEGIIDYFDYPDGTVFSTIYQFDKGSFIGVRSEEIINKKTVISSKTQFKMIENKIILQKTSQDGSVYEESYERSSSEIKIANGKNNGLIAALIKIQNNKFEYYPSLKLYAKYPTRADWVVEFEDNRSVISVYRNGEILLYKYYFVDGILMSVEYADGRIEKYSTNNGIGQIVITDNKAIVLEVRQLERKLDANGFLIYEKVRYSDKTGYEYLFLSL